MATTNRKERQGPTLSLTTPSSLLSLSSRLIMTTKTSLTGHTGLTSHAGGGSRSLTGRSSLMNTGAFSSLTHLKSTSLTTHSSSGLLTTSTAIRTKPQRQEERRAKGSSKLSSSKPLLTAGTTTTRTSSSSLLKKQGSLGTSLTTTHTLSSVSGGKTSTRKPTQLTSSTTSMTGLTSRTKLGAKLGMTKSLLSTGSLLSSKSIVTSSGRFSLLTTQRALPTSSATRVEAPPASSTPAIVAVPVAKELEDAPRYNFSSEMPHVEEMEELEFLPPERDASVQPTHTPLVDVTGLKTTLINAVATSLLCSPDFRNRRDPTFRNLHNLSEKLSHYDAEFILKLALYTRCDLNVRTTANFLLALAANVLPCRPYLRKYFCASVRLPSDWIEVAEIYQAFHDSSIQFGAIPTSLRKVMATKFPEFDAYQLAKYNKESSRRKRKQKGKEEKGKEEKGKEEKGKPNSPGPVAKKALEKPPSISSSESSDSDSDASVVGDELSESEEELERLSFTLKQLIRKIHISEPVEHVMCLVGKRYPEDPESFRRSKLPGMWDQDRAGKRMKLPTPETWETQVSLKGNKAATWEGLIDHSKLPFMAMLRNLRNLILAGISPKHHQWVINKLNDERAVTNSRQFPFRFFSAYEVLGELEKIAKGEAPTSKPARPMKGKPGKKPKPKKVKELPTIEPKLVQRYRTALDNALKIATCYNVKPIPGLTLILCNVGSNMSRPCTAARGLGKPRTVQEVGVLLALMCKYSCERCTMYIYGQSSYEEVSLEEGTILHNMESILGTASRQGLDANEGKLPVSFLHGMLVDQVPLDNLVLLTDSMKLDDQQGKDMLDFLKKYRQLVNPNLLFVSVDLSGRSSGLSSTIKPQHENDIHLAGYSDQILRFIAERGDSGQLTYVDNIDKAYNLVAVKLPGLASSNQLSTLAPEKALLAAGHHKWRNVRVFISSTFRDMHGERDLLTRFIFPELRARAHARHIQLYEVDLRWGVTETDTRSHKALEICLGEISRCQYFIGLLGERYGWIQDEYQTTDSPEYDWVKKYPPGRSITELEMYHAALCDADKAVGKAFFFFRDPSFLPWVPEPYRKDFETDPPDAGEKMENLKSDIRISGLEVYDGYPCKWLGEVEGKPMVGGLEDFGLRVLHNLWNAIQRDYPEDEVGEDPIAQATVFHEAFAESRSSSFVGRRALLKDAQGLVERGENPLIVAAGKPGSGKSAFMAAFAQHYSESGHCKSPTLILSHFIGAAPDSTNIASILTRFCHEMKRRFSVTLDIPEEYTDLVMDWPRFLEESIAKVGKGSTMLVLIDGLDLLEDAYNGRAMDWIPDKITDGVVILLSTVEGGACHSVLRRRQPPPAEVTIGAMDIWDKAEMVRRSLAKHRKSLDESAFNNQMKLLLTKKEASNPLYLHLACEELRVFGVFEQVTAFLKKMPPTIPSLLQEVLNRLEIEHSQEFLSTSLALLCLVRSGLLEFELSSILSAFFNKEKVKALLPPMVTTRLLRSLQTFLQPTGQENSDLLSLAHKDIEKAVRLRYMRGAASDKERMFHKLLADYFKSEADPSGDGKYKGNNTRAFCELPYHLMAAGAWKELEEMLCNIQFVVAKCRLGLAHQLLEDYTPSPQSLPAGKARELGRFIQLPKIQLLKSFVSRNLHVLVSNPSLALQQAVNEPSGSLVSEVAEEMVQGNHTPLLRWINKQEEVHPCHMTITSHSGPITCVAVSQEGSLFATGSKNGTVKLYEAATGKELQTFVGHAAAITSICFVGSHALCSASHDTTLSLWDTWEGIRIATMKGHTRSVRDCAANSAGKVIASVSWDLTIRLWDGRDGKSTAFLKTPGQHNTPINCISFHPEGQLIVVGSWDASLKIWDTFNRKRLKTLKGHCTSVQACSYAPSGRHIVSAALDGEVKIWSTKSGSAVGSIAGHHSPVNSIAYTPNGQYLVTGSSDKLVKVWSGSMGQPVFSMGATEFGYAHCLSFDSPSQTVRVGYHDGHVRQFNVQTGAEVFSVKIHEAPVVGVAYMHQIDMSASVDGSIKVWRPASLPQYIDLIGHKAPISCAVWEEKGFASASEDLAILIWPHNPRTYRAMATKPNKKKGAPAPDAPTPTTVDPTVILHTNHTAKITSLAFSLDGLRMVSTSHDKSLIIWDMLSYKQLQTLHACHKDWINACAFSDTSSDILVTGSNDFTLKLWDLKTGTEKSTFKGHTSAINSVAFSQGCIVSAAVDGSVKVWTHKGVEITTMYCHRQRVNACLVDIPEKQKSSSLDWADVAEGEDSSSDTKRQQVKLQGISVLTASDDGTIGVWRPFVPNEITSLVGHSDRVLSVATTRNNHILSSSLDGSVRVWTPVLHTEPGGLVKSTFKGHVGPVSSCALSPAGSCAVTAGRDGHFVLWSIRDGAGGLELERMYEVRVSDKALSSVCFTDKEGVAVGGDDGALSFYQCSTTEYAVAGQVVEAAMLMGTHPISKLALTPDQKHVVAGSWSSKLAAVHLASADGRKKVSSLVASHKDWVTDLVAVEEEGHSVIYSVGLDSCLYRWTVPPAPTSRTSRLPPSMSSATRYSISLEDKDREQAWLLAVCEVGPFLALGDSKGRLTLWNRSTKRIEVTKRLHKRSINALATVGGNLVTGSDDSTVKIWKLTSTPVGLKQIGHFYCQSCVTTLAATRGGKNRDHVFMVGDSLGHVTLLQWCQ